MDVKLKGMESAKFRYVWKYVDKKTKAVHLSWERWDSHKGFWENRIPPEEGLKRETIYDKYRMVFQQSENFSAMSEEVLSHKGIKGR